MSSILLEKEPIITQPTFIDRNDIRTNENLVPLKTIDYNSIAEEIVERNETAIDAIVQTQLKTEIVTTPEPSNFSFFSIVKLLGNTLAYSIC